MALPTMEYTKTWRSATDFPTEELNEEKVRDDAQLLHDEAKDYINEQLIPALGASDAATFLGADVASVGTKTVQAVLDAHETRLNSSYTSTQADTLVATNTNDLVKTVAFNDQDGKFTFTKKDGSTVVIDTLLEKVPVSMVFETVEGVTRIKLTNQDGSTSFANVSALVDNYTFSNTDTVSLTVSGVGNQRTITAAVRDASVGLSKLNPEVISTIQGYYSSAESAKTAAATSESNALLHKNAAATSEANALTYKAEAASSATNAATSASTATTKASDASTYAANANTSKLAAEAAKNTAVSAKDEAVSAQNAAVTAATNAANSVTGFSAIVTTANNNIDTKTSTFDSKVVTANSTIDTKVSTATTKATDAANSATAASGSATTATAGASTATTQASIATTKASEAAASAATASAATAGVTADANKSKSYAVGTTGTRAGEDTDNSKYWCEQSRAIATGDVPTRTEAQGYVSTHADNALLHKQSFQSVQIGAGVNAEGMGTIAAVLEYPAYNIETVATATKVFTVSVALEPTAVGRTVLFTAYLVENDNEAALTGDIVAINGLNVTISTEVDLTLYADWDTLYLVSTHVENFAGQHAEGISTVASGRASHAEGLCSVASGSSSHAEGYSIASGEYAHAEGSSTSALGVSSHAEGKDSEAIGVTAHAEGSGSKASGDYSHAEGYTTVASNYYAHAEGYNTVASGVYAHVEGSMSTASGDASHAEGSTTTASGSNSHAEGATTKATGESAHAEGSSSIAAGINSHAQGFATAAATSASHAEGEYNLASNGFLYKITAFDNVAKTITLESVAGLSVSGVVDVKVHGAKALMSVSITAINGLVVTLNTTETITAAYKCIVKRNATMRPTHTEGSNTVSTGDRSHAEGNTTTASGVNSHAEGSTTTASGSNSHAEGSTTTASGNVSHAEGMNTAASGSNSHAEGYASSAVGDYSHSQNRGTITQGLSQTAVGEYNIAQGVYNSKVNTDHALIVGNGTSDVARSNAMSLTWEGTLEVAKDVKVAGSSLLARIAALEAAVVAHGITL